MVNHMKNPLLSQLWMSIFLIKAIVCVSFGGIPPHEKTQASFHGDDHTWYKELGVSAIPYDSAENAFVIPNMTNWCSGINGFTTLGKTGTGPTASCNAISPHANVWFRFQATSTTITIDLSGLGQSSLTLWDGNLNELVCETDALTTGSIQLGSVSLVVGDWYYISVDNISASSIHKRSFTICVSEQPSYDFSQGAIEIPHTADWSSAGNAYTTRGMTGDGVSTSCNSLSPFSNVWFKFQATASHVTVDLLGLGASNLTLWDTNFNELICETDGLTEGSIQISSVSLVVGDWYHLSVDHTATQALYRKSFGLRVRNTASYDFKEGALEIPHSADWSSASNAYTTAGMTADGPSSSCNPLSPFSNVWFKFQATAPHITVDLSVLGKSNLTLWDANFNELICETDGLTEGSIQISSVSLVVGDWYHLSVDHTATQALYRKSFGLRVRNTASYDFKEGAIEIPGGNNQCSDPAAYTTAGMTADGANNNCLVSLPNNNVWFKFRSWGPSATVDLKSGGELGRLLHASLTLWDDTFTELSCVNDEFGNASITLSELVSGNTYYISVDNYNTLGIYIGAFTLCLDNPSNGSVPDYLEIIGLRDLYEITNGPGWTNNTGWPSTPAQWDTITTVDQLAGWFGVTVLDGDIQELKLSNNNLSGPLSTTLGELKGLRNLELKGNSLSGAIPSQIGELSSLMHLDLSQNTLVDPIPSQLGALSALEFLSLADNNLVGNIPLELGRLFQLKELYLSANQLTGEIPFQLGSISQLERLCLDGNSLSGPIPSSFGFFKQLRILNLQSNALAGFIPNELGQIDSLRSLYLSNNNLNGGLPTSLGNLPKLERILAGHNALSSQIPVTFGNLSHLSTLSLAHNQLTGTIPEVLGNLTGLDTLSLRHNQLQGDIPVTLLGLENLKVLYVDHNYFTSFPDFNTHINPGQIKVHIQQNYIPQTDIDANLVLGLDIFDEFIYSPQNAINGTAQDLLEIRALRDLYESTGGDSWTSQNDGDPSNDWPRGTEWDSITTLDSTITWYGLTIINGDATGLDLNNNSLTGVIPSSISGLKVLNSLQLRQNSLSSIEEGIGELDGLRKLDIGFNALTQLPDDIGSLSNLEELMVDNNQLIVLPTEIGWLTSLERLYLRSNQLRSLPGEMANLSELRVFDIGHNQLRGHLPVWIRDWFWLHTLKMDHNAFTGSLPQEWGRLILVKNLDLSYNQLSGELPADLPLGFFQLTTLLLAGNQLQGGVSINYFSSRELTTLHLQDNHFTRLPNLSHVLNAGWLNLQVANNALDFGDLESGFNAQGQTKFNVFTYTPQAEIPTYFDAATLTFSVETGGVNNQYQWMKNGVDLPGATASTLTVLPQDFHSENAYQCKVTNSTVPGLTLTSKAIYTEGSVGTYWSVGDGNWTTSGIWSKSKGGSPVEGYPKAGDTVNINGNEITVSSDLSCGPLNLIVEHKATSLVVDGAVLTVNGEVTLDKVDAAFTGNVKVINNGKLVLPQ